MSPGCAKCCIRAQRPQLPTGEFTFHRIQCERFQRIETFGDGLVSFEAFSPSRNEAHFAQKQPMSATSAVGCPAACPKKVVRSPSHTGGNACLNQPHHLDSPVFAAMRRGEATEGPGSHVQEARDETSEHRDARRDDGGFHRGHHAQRQEGGTGRLLQLDQQVTRRAAFSWERALSW